MLDDTTGEKKANGREVLASLRMQRLKMSSMET